jgi:single-strand DNA-binding protein
MAGSVNKVILIGNLGKDPEIRRTQDGRPIANLSVATSESWRDKATGEAEGKDRMAPRRHLQREALPDRRAILEEGLEGLSRRLAADAQMAGSIGQDKYSTEVVLQGFNSQLTMLDRRVAAVARSAPTTPAAAISDRPVPSTRERKPAMAGAGKRGDMDDEIPF